MLGENLGGAALLLVHDAPDFQVNLPLCLRREALRDGIFLDGVVDGAQAVGHSPLADHLPGDVCGLLDIHGGARRDVLHGEFLGGASAEADCNHVQELALGEVEFVVLGEGHGEAHGIAPGDDGDFMQGHCLGAAQDHQGMPRLVVGREPAALRVHLVASSFPAPAHLVPCLFQVGHGDGLPLGPGGQEGGLVDQVFQFRPGEPGGAPGDDAQVHVLRQPGFPGMDLEDGDASPQVGEVHGDLAVEASRPQQGMVQDIGAVGGGDDDDSLVGLEAVHFHQECVEGLFPFVVAAAHAVEAGAPHRVDFIDEDEAGGVLLGVGEHAAHAGGAHAHEHFHEIGAGDGIEGDSRLAGDGLCQEGLSRAGGADQQDAPGDSAAQPSEGLGVLEILHNLLHFLLRLVASGHVPEGDGAPFAGFQPAGAGLAEVHGAAGAPHLPGEDEIEEGDEQDRGEEHEEHLCEGASLGLGLVEGAVFPDHGVQRVAVDDLCHELLLFLLPLPLLEPALDGQHARPGGFGDGQGGHGAPLQDALEFALGQFQHPSLVPHLGVSEEGDEHQEDEPEDILPPGHGGMG